MDVQDLYGRLFRLVEKKIEDAERDGASLEEIQRLANTLRVLKGMPAPTEDEEALKAVEDLKLEGLVEDPDAPDPSEPNPPDPELVSPFGKEAIKREKLKKAKDLLEELKRLQRRIKKRAFLPGEYAAFRRVVSDLRIYDKDDELDWLPIWASITEDMKKWETTQ